MSLDFIFKALEELKSQGAADVVLSYGEAVGIDDIGVDPFDRNVRITWVPHGCSRRVVEVIWQGTLASLRTFNFSIFPNISIEYIQPDKPGLYIRGDLEIIKRFVDRGSLDYRQWIKNE